MRNKALAAIWLYLFSGWLIAASITTWAEKHCPQPFPTFTEGAIIAVSWGVMFPAVAVWGAVEQPKHVCTR